jgi:hypothetical protein
LQQFLGTVVPRSYRTHRYSEQFGYFRVGVSFYFEKQNLLVSDGQQPHGPSVQVINFGDGIGAQAVVFKQMLEGEIMAVFIRGLVEG